ncbi:MAG: hypothetical protein MUF00_05875 [Gemmatimonadaceae bacterium]|nr:hypothetical protein [Gemmatimonadaceae bacterium]
MSHALNLLVHILAGTLGIALGLLLLARPKGTVLHRRRGQRFVQLVLIVCTSAMIGLVVFRFMPLFAVLAVLVLYQVVSGWRVARTQHGGPAVADALWTLATALAIAALMPRLLANAEQSPVVVRSTLAATGMLLLYDTVRWVFPRRWHARLWPYEHVYRMNGALFGMVAALVGNTVRVWQPVSQLLPTAIGSAVTAYYFVQLSRRPSDGRLSR